MTPRNKPSSALVAIVAVLGFLIVLGGISVAAAGPARAPADSPTPILAGEPGPMAPIPGDIVAVARYNGQPGSAPARSSPAADPALYRFFFPWVDLDTTLYVQNPAGGVAVTVVLNLYDLDGVSIYSDFATIPANGSLAWDLATFGSLPAGFEGSALLESDGPIAAVASVQTAANSLLAYNGAVAGDTEVVLPAIMRQYYDWNTSIWVQNTGTTEADVIVEYYAYGGGLVYTHSDTIPPFTSHVYRQEQMLELPAIFNGLAHIAATGESVAVVVETRNSVSSRAGAYDGLALSTADQVLLSPRQQKTVEGWSSATQITNLGAMDANVDAGWYLGDGSTTWTQSSSLAPMEAALYYLPGLPGLPDGFDGSLIVDSDQIGAALVNWTNSSVAGDGFATSLTIGSSQLDTSTFLARVAHSLTAGTSTEFSIQNPGMTATDVTIRFYNQSGAATETLNDTIPSLGVHRYATGDVGALGDEWEGSVVIESTQAVAVEAVQLLIAPEVNTCPIVSNPDDSGSGTLRDCLERAGTGDTITFDTAVFPPGSPVSITLATALPLIVTDSLTIDGSNAGVILDGSQVGATPEIVLLDDISLTLDGGPNLINNGDFSSGLDYWQASDEHPGATRTLNSSDYFSAPPSLEWGLVAHTRESSTNYTEWINAAEGSTIVVHLWYRYGRVAVNVDARFADDDDTFREQWLPWQADWTEATIVETVPPEATAISVSFVCEHSEMRASGLASTASGVTIQGLQVVNFPGSGIWLLDGAQYALIGGDSALGVAPLGQGNLLSGNYANGIRIEGVGTMSNTVSGNWIGTDASGTSAFGNLEGGVFIMEGAANNRIGGQTEGERNVITYNYGDGVGIENWGTNENRIEGNWIGVDVDGTRDVDVSVVAYSPAYASDRTIFLGTVNQGLFKSTDGGVHWSEVGGNVFEGSAISGLALSPAYSTDETLFVGAGGLRKSTDGGATWADASPLPNRAPRSFALSPDYGNDQTLLAGFLLSWVDGQMVGGAFKSTDGGLSWVQLDLTAPTGHARAADTPDGTGVGLPGDSEPWSLEPPILGEPAEGEGPATPGSTPLASQVVAFSPDYAQDQTLFVGTWGGDGGLYKSVDDGVTWAAMNSGLDGTSVSQISFSPDYGNDATLFVLNPGSGAHPYRSTDGGTTWNILTSGLPAYGSTAVALAISPGFPADHTLYIVYLHADSGLGSFFRSLDRGNAWTETMPGLQHQHMVKAVAVSPNHTADDELLLATGANGLLRSQDRGDTWLLAGGDLTDAGNSGSGVGVYEGAQGNLIGGQAVGAGNLISNNGFNGVTLEDEDTSGNRVMGNYIGTDASGTDGLRNAASGVRIRAGALENTIGGLHPSMGDQCSGACNLISGNGGDGVRIEGSGTVSNTVSGNYIGTGPWGMERNGNMGNGVAIDAYASHNRIGGTDEGLGNLISGNDSMALFIRDSSDNQVLGNLVGTDATGTAPLSNVAGLGLYWDAKRNLLENNVIASNNFYGLQIALTGAADNVVRGNWIGTNASDHDLGNAWGGIEITSNAGPNTIGPGNVIKYNKSLGVAANGHDHRIVDNEIAYNGGSGVDVAGQSSLRNTITVNSIYGNGGLGIHLVDGGNTELPAPVVLVYDTAAGTASGTACPLCTVEVFSDEDEEGRWYEGTVVADALGHWSFDKGAPFTGAVIHATATDADGNTSEFSGPLHDIAVVGAAPGGEVAIGEARGVHAELRNEGSQPENNVPVHCSIENTGYDETRTSGEIPPATWAMLAFPDWVPTAGGVFTLTCESLLGDENPANDRFTQPVTVTVPGGPDVWTKDNWEDTGDVPSTQPWWVSPDIWVRHQPDGGLVHQNPIAFEQNTVYVRLRNRGGSPASGVVQVFWDRSRIGWPCKVGEPNVGTIPFEDLAPGEVRILSLPWTPEEPGEHGLHTVIEAEGDPANSAAPCSPHRPRWDNNVSWHNVIAYFHPLQAGRRPLSLEEVEVDLVNIYDWPKDTDLVLERDTFPAMSTIHLRLDEALFDRWWSYAGRWQEGVAVDEATKQITVTGEVSATLGALPLAAEEQVTATLAFVAADEGAFDVRLYERVDGGVVGGISYQWLELDTVPPEVVSTSPPHGAVGVALDASLVITFSEPIGPLSFGLALDPDPGSTGWLATWNLAGTVVTVTHPALSPGQTYNAAITAGDAFANPLAAHPWSFTTVATGERYIYLPVVLRH